jgi:hypothetical protein
LGIGVSPPCFSVVYFFAVNARASEIFPENQYLAENGSEDAAEATVTDKKLGVGV